ncbi:hypothetical protein D5S17_34870 [Pseudonocardiaceae bacterium YIM PH 21723]|nr:hypothetical protein D5S17_34870 [Pseudonocardiaceae bacterium YIM PH 21723]
MESVNCSEAHESISARIDGERPSVPDEVLDRHLAGCPACQAWQEQAIALRRATMLREAPRVPDLTARILAEVTAPCTPRRGARLALGLVALAQSVLGLAALAGLQFEPMDHMSHGGLAAVHLSNESAAWNVAVGIGLLWAAMRPAKAAGLLPALTGFVVVLGVICGIDLLAGQVAMDRVTSHGLVVVGLVLLFVVHRQHTRLTAPPPAGQHLPVPGETGMPGSGMSATGHHAA